MSDRTHGVVFEAEEEGAVEFFCNLEPVTFLRLLRLDEKGLWGIGVEGWPGDDEALDKIARLASIEFGISLRYIYDGAVGYLHQLYENGRLTWTQVADDEVQKQPTPFRGDIFSVFGRDRGYHNVVESAFHLAGESVLDIGWRPGGEGNHPST